MVAAFRYEDGTTIGVVASFVPLSMVDLTCANFVRTPDLCAVPTADIKDDVSFAHACGRGCAFKKRWERGALRGRRQS